MHYLYILLQLGPYVYIYMGLIVWYVFPWIIHLHGKRKRRKLAFHRGGVGGDYYVSLFFFFFAVGRHRKLVHGTCTISRLRKDSGLSFPQNHSYAIESFQSSSINFSLFNIKRMI